MQAFQYWAGNFAVWPNDLLEIGHEYGSYALCYWDRVQPNSCLHLALSAFSLALFGRAKCMNTALKSADNFYAQSIIKIQKEIKELSSETIDQLLVVVMLMGIFHVRYKIFSRAYYAYAYS
jgi:hypothetical protein